MNDAEDTESSDLPLIDIFLNKAKREDVQKMEAVMKELVNANFPVQQIGKNFSSLFNLLWTSSLPCFSKNNTAYSDHLLKKCVLHGKEVDCSKIFRTIDK